MNLVTLLHDLEREHPDKALFIEGGQVVTYADFTAKVARMAHNLRAAGIGPGDRLLVLSGISQELYAALCAVWAVGACVVMFDPSAGRAHVEACTAAIDIRAFVGSRKTLLLRFVSPPIRRIKKRFDVGKLMEGGPAALSAEPVADNTPALITFTSGTTGTPKAIVRSHGFLLGQDRAIRANMPYRPGDIDLAVLPVFTLVNMVAGVTTVLPDDSLRDIAKVDGAKLIDQIVHHGVNRITSSPTLIARLCEAARQRGVKLGGLTAVNVGGGPVFPHFLEGIADIIDPRSVRIVYGSTEAEPIAEMRYADMTDRDKQAMREAAGLLVGHVVPEVDLRIIKPVDGPIAAADLCQLDKFGCERGEILVAGDHVVTSYLDPAQNAATKIKVGNKVYHRTGDCGYLDAENRLWLLGRVGQVIERDGETLYPFALESAVMAGFPVSRVAVTAVDGRCYLAVEGGAHCLDPIREAYGRQVDEVVNLPQIPLDNRHRSKVDYPALQKRLRQ